MKKRQHTRASALQVALSLVLTCISVILFATSFRAAPPNTNSTTQQAGFYPPLPLQQNGFYPPLPVQPDQAYPHLPYYPPSPNAPTQGVTVTAPTANMDVSVPSTTVINLPVTATTINPSLNYIGFQGDLIFDSAIAAPSPGNAPVAAAGLTASNWTVSGNVLNTGPGTLKTLRVSAFVNDGVTPLDGTGLLYNIKWVRVSNTSGTSTALTWHAPPDDFIFIDADLNSVSSIPGNGLLTITGPTPTPAPTPTASPVPTASPTPTPSAAPTSTPTATPSPAPTATPTPTAQPVKVSLPTDSLDTSVPISSVILEPVVSTNIDPSLNYVGFQGDFTFDSTVVSFSAPFVAAGGLTGSGWTVSGNVLNTGPGTLKTLRVSAFVNDGVTPLTGSGTLYNVRMLRVSDTPGASTSLTWKPAPDNFYFIDGDLSAAPPLQNNGLISITGVEPTPTSTPTPTPSPTPTPEPTASPTPTATPSPTPEPTATPTPEPTVTPTATVAPTATPTATPEPTATASPTPELTATPTATAAPTATPTATPEPTATATATAVPTATPTPEPTATATAAPTATPTATAAPTASPSPTAEPTATATPAPTASPSPSPEPTATPAPTATPGPTMPPPTATPTPEPTVTPNPTPEPTSTPTPLPTATVTPSPTASPNPSCNPGTFVFEGNSSTSGTMGNIRTFTLGNVTVNASGFSRNDSTGHWDAGFLGIYAQGFGVTDVGEGDGSNNQHVVDNLGGYHDYVLLEFNSPILLDRFYLDYVYNGDSDISVWIGTTVDPINNHNILSDAFLTGIGPREDNNTSSSFSRWADVNATGRVGNTIVIAASVIDSQNNDTFKLHKLLFGCPGTTPTPTPNPTSTPTATPNPTPTPTPAPTCSPGTFRFEGHSATSGTAGNIRTFVKNGVTVKVSAFSRKDYNGAWNTGWLGVYGDGLGVTDIGEGSGSNNRHVVDNIGGYHDYVLFEFSTPIVVTQAFLDYIYNDDSDMAVWIGTKNNPITNHNTLSDAFLSSIGPREDNDTSSTAFSRWASFNAANRSGNVIVIAASVADTTPEDTFKIHKLQFCKPSH